jgi:hypothetical protein
LNRDNIILNKVIIKTTIFFKILILLCIVNSSYATIINVPNEQPTIQDGIDSANDGDTVLVQPGLYLENLYLYKKNIHIFSLYPLTLESEYINQTVIDGQDSKSVIRIYQCDSLDIRGFTLQSGYGSKSFWIGSKNGGGIACDESPNVIIRNTIIKDNFAHYGGGIICIESNLTLINVTVVNNETLYNGLKLAEGIYGYLSEIVVVNSIFTLEQHMWLAGTDLIIGYSNYDDITINDTSLIDLGNNIRSVDPLFLNADSGVYSLKINSPCFNTGTAHLVWEEKTLVDLQSDEYLSTAPDMGALELYISENPPVMDSILTQEMLEDDSLVILLSATDLDGDELIYHASCINSEFYITIKNNNELIIKAPLNWNGEIEIDVSVSDGAWIDSTYFTLNVQSVNDPPFLEIDNQAIVENTPLELLLPKTDIDQDTIEYSAVCLSEKVNLIIENNVLTLTPEIPFVR